MTDVKRRAWQVLRPLLFVAWLGAAGMVLGFCAGYPYGAAFGDHSGHGLGDIGYLFKGAILGIIVGLLVGVGGVLAWSPRAQLRVAAWAGGAALIASLAAVILT